MESPDPKLIAKAFEDMRKHLELLQAQFFKALSKEELVSNKDG